MSGSGGGDTSDTFSQTLGSLGIGYDIAISLGLLFLLCSILLAIYVCCRSSRISPPSLSNPHSNSNSHTVVFPRVIFVAEQDEENANYGLNPTIINTYPKFFYSTSNDRFNEGSICSICLGEYKDGELLRLLPDCRHFFHLNCVDAWLRLNASCPVCRTSPLPTPISTPLSELVPLSQFTGNRSEVPEELVIRIGKKTLPGNESRRQ